MAENEKIILWGKAKKLGIDGYRSMSVDALKTAIKKAEGGSAPATKAPAKTAATGAKRKTAATAKRKPAAAKSPAKKTTTTKTAVSKKKTAGAKSAPAAKAKRPTTGAAKTTAKKTVTKPAAKKTTARKASPAKSASTATSRIPINDAEIDWAVESRVGNGKDNRGKIMGHLRRFKGNVEKVYAKLEDSAQEMYPKTADNRKRSKASAQDLLRWHISRIKFDFVKDTQQGRFATNGSRKRSTATTAVKKVAGKKTAAKKSTGPARKPAATKSAASRKKTARK